MNVSLFWAVVVLPQALLCLCTVGLLLLRAVGVLRLHMPLRPLFSWLLARFRHLSPQAELVRCVLWGSGNTTRMAAWEGLSLLHWGGLCVALGSLASLFFSVAVTDLAFGWQSTLQVGAQGMHALVSVICLPWSWLPQAWGLCPSLAHIEGSRMVLKEGITTLENVNLVVWWPFLAMSLGTYAVMPRFVLLVLCRLRLWHLERILIHPDLERIIDRMHAPLLESRPSAEPPADPLPLGDQYVAFSEPSFASADRVVGAVLIAPPEWEGRISEDRLRPMALFAGGQAPVDIFYAPLEPDAMAAVLNQLQTLAWVRDRQRCVLAIEAWQPPIRELLEAIRILAAHVSSVALLLCGRPLHGDWLVPPNEVEKEVWAAAIKRLHWEYIEIFGVPQ